MSNQITAANDQLTQRQQTLQAQFTAMETALAQINAQGSSLLAGLGITSNSSSKSSG